jgi:hypothetical protein
MQIESKQIEILLGCLFVLLHAVHRFNTPMTNRSSTTALRYYAATGTYGGLLITTYLVAVLSPLFVEFVKTGAHVNEEWAAHVVGQPLLIALMLTILLPTLPILEPLDEALRKGLQRMAAIPHEARRLAAEMRKARFTVPVAARQRVRAELTRHAFDPNDVVFDANDTLRGSWTTLTALVSVLRDWEGDRRFTGFIGRFEGDYNRILHRYEQLGPKLRKWFTSARDIGAGEGSLKELAHQYQADLSDQCSDVMEDLYTFISRGLLKCEFTYAQRTDRLRSIGFELTVYRPRLTLNRLMMLFGSISLVFIFGMTLIQEWIRLLLHPGQDPVSGTPTMGTVLTRTIMIAVIYVAAACCAILPKERWAAARREPGDERPVAFYFAASIGASVLSLVISFCIRSRY